ncbi:SIS domain-containing protein [Fidelibacter multiformis]|jgi:D-sedoheptulose 7-phosphate isomerase|uniref:D-sedoheptulose-7-phosphate isomerase n=1 Tax=Fidelibacter multiformis TaxID=3377529 RepID=UPI0037DC2385
MMNSSFDLIRAHLKAGGDLKHRIAASDDLVQRIYDASAIMIRTLKKGKKILWCGNGGSAADSQHLSAELVARLNITRPGLASLALTTDTSLLTAWSNDVGFESLFSRQVEALGDNGDVLMALSTSGKSPNVLKAVKSAREKKITTIALLGRDGGVIRSEADLAIVVPSENTQLIQEIHVTVGHLLCELVETKLFKT